MSSPKWLDYGVPNLDRPFGLALWPIFETAFTKTVGYLPQDFRFEQGVTPFSTFTTTATVLISYYIVIFGGREVMRNRAPLQLNWLFKVHNLYLTLISGTLLVLFAEQLIPTVARHGVFFAICSHEGGWTDKLVILYYVSSLSCSSGVLGIGSGNLGLTGVDSLTILPNSWSCWILASCSSRRSRLVSVICQFVVTSANLAS